MVYNVSAQPGSRFTGADLSFSVFQGSTFVSVTFYGANLSGAVLSGGSFTHSNFESANLTGVTFDTDLTGALFQGANLTGVVWGANTVCPDQTSSSSDGNTCIGHLSS
jgi:uncharacterized protein YjbI with pentapeptide repeats